MSKDESLILKGIAILLMPVPSSVQSDAECGAVSQFYLLR